MLLKATTEVEFSFDNEMYKQVDGVAMGSPLGPILADIFVGHCESSIPEDHWPCLYDKFVDDTFALFDNEEGSQQFSEVLNNLHPALAFALELENTGYR